MTLDELIELAEHEGRTTSWATTAALLRELKAAREEIAAQRARPGPFKSLVLESFTYDAARAASDALNNPIHTQDGGQQENP